MFSRPEKLIYKIILLLLTIFLALLFYFEKQWFYLVIPLFSLVWMIIPESKEDIETTKKITIVRYIFVALILNMSTEGLAILQNISLPSEDRILFHPDPLYDLLLSILYYLPIAITVSRPLSKNHYTIRGVFIVSGIYGVMTENFFLVLLSLNPFIWAVVFVLYGSFFTIPYVILRPYFEELHLYHKSDNRAKFSLFINYFIGFAIAFVLFAIVLTIFPFLKF